MSSEEYELFEKIHASKGMEYINRMKAYSFSFNIFNGNRVELEQALLSMENPDIGIHLMSQDNRQAGDQFHSEVNRLFHNFLSSAKTLIEHTRIFVEKHYKNTSIQQAYSEKIVSEFSKNELCRFVQDLRNYMLHQGLPHSQMILTITNESEGQNIESKISLDIKELANWSRWSANSKSYLKKQGKEVKLSSIVSPYSEKIISLHVWLDSKIKKHHSADLKELKNLQNRYQAHEDKKTNK
ncbi:MAG: hypothetical protein QM484_07455 [Woeseiaceae bacterium]